jgi:hypothetical protein
MAEAKISQLAKLLSAVMECEDVPVEIHNAIADWSCPSTYRVTNSPELFQMILDDTKAHPEDYEDIPKVGHPVRPGEGPKLVLAEKETPQSQPAATGLTLGQHLSAVLNSPDLPSGLYTKIWDCLGDIPTRDLMDTPDFLDKLLKVGREREQETASA